MDSANRTFITMIILTAFFFVYTTTLLFFKKEQVPINEPKDYTKTNEIEKTNGLNSIVDSNVYFEVINSDLDSEKTIIYENNKIKIQFNRKSGTIENAWIKNGSNNEYNIVDGASDNSALHIKLGSWLTGRTIDDLTNGKEIYNFNIIDNIYIFKISLKDNKNNIDYIIEKKYKFIENENIFNLTLNISNNKNIPFKFDQTNKAFSIGWGPSIGVKSLPNNKRSDRYDIYGFLSSDKLVNINEKNKIFKENKSLYAELPKMIKDTWLVANSHYNATVLLPVDNSEYSYFFDYRQIKNDVSYCGFSKKTNNSIIESNFTIYIGPKLSSVLKKYDNFSQNGIYLENANFTKLDPKIIFGLGNVIGFILNYINKFVNNYGLSIIILTIIIKLLLSPLTHHSMVSQQKMQTVQPKMKELQAKYKDKPDLLNKKTMELYQKEGINPMSGCLPLILQMPILFAMYQLLDRMVELKGASFLWIKDLAMPDSIFSFGFTIPLINSSTFNILPVIMVLTQIATSMLTPDVQNNKQAKMMMWMMPIMFFFFFYNVASALVLYWTVMNILGIAQQAFIKYKGTHSIVKK